MKILKICLTALLTLALLPVFAGNSNTEENRKKLEKINEEIKTKINKQYKLYEDEKNVLFQIQRYDQKLDEKRNALKSYNAKLAGIENSINALKNQMGYSNSEMGKIEQNLKKSVVQVYREGRYKKLKLLMSAVSLKDFVRKYNFLLLMAKKDIELRNRYLSQKNSYNSARRNLEANYDNYKKLKAGTKKKEEEILAEQESKKKLLKGILTEKALFEQAINEMRSQSLKLEDLAKEIEDKTKQVITVDTSDIKGDILKNKGKLAFPVPGSIVSGFGKYKHPKFNVYIFNNGIELAAKQDQEVLAVFDGIVLFADWFKGYGKTVLVDCGDNIITVYGHFSEINVNVGQKIANRQVLGKAGENGPSDTPTVYFEIRKDGKPENPADWLKKN